MYPNSISIDYEILRDNFIAYREFYPETLLAPVIKAEAYGHGQLKAAQAFLSGGAQALTVFRLEEAVSLRRSGVGARILCLLGALPSEAGEAVRLDHVTLGVYCFEQAEALSRACAASGRRATVHLAVDTGMGRLGFLASEAPAAASRVAALPGLDLVGCYSHVANAGEPEHPITVRQVAAFRQAVRGMPAGCVENHLCASDALVNGLAPELPWARPGLCLYMERPAGRRACPRTRDAMSVSSRLISVKRLPAGYPVSYGSLHKLSRDSVVGVVPVGYDDGYQRSMSDKGCMLVHGRRVRQLGRICMSMAMVDLTDVPEAALGDEVVLLGRQGGEAILLSELAGWANTTEHELICMMGARR